jgi:hypothetical protein
MVISMEKATRLLSQAMGWHYEPPKPNSIASTSTNHQIFHDTFPKKIPYGFVYERVLGNTIENCKIIYSSRSVCESAARIAQKRDTTGAKYIIKPLYE